MNDQAQRLRDLINKSRAERGETVAPTKQNLVSSPASNLKEEKLTFVPPVQKREDFGDARIITVTSGKGGVGKTNMTVNLSIALQSLGKRVSVIDADLGLANVDLALGMVSRYNLLHYIKQDMPAEQITMTGPLGLQVISGGSGLLDLVNLNDNEIVKLVNLLSILNKSSDYIFVDTGAGLNKSVLSFIEATKEVILVVTPDPTSITDAYAVIKNVNPVDKDIKIIVNMADSMKESSDVFNKLQIVADKFLGAKLTHLGSVPNDVNVRNGIRAQEPFYLKFPNTAASKNIREIANTLAQIEQKVGKTNSFKGFLKRLFS